MVGKRFGRLVVESRTKERQNGSVVWKCKCDCGNYKNVPTHSLQNNHTQSCGCLIREIHGIDITNQKFGKLTALYPIKSDSSTLVWHCKCECGNECDINGSFLRCGLTKSCGCISSSIGEINIQTILKENSIKYKKEYCVKEIGNLRFDFAIIKNDVVVRLIEFDGIQHYSDRSGVWNRKDSFKRRQERDNRKNKWAFENNIPLVRIPYWERDNITIEMITGDKYLVK